MGKVELYGMINAQQKINPKAKNIIRSVLV